MEKPKVVLIGRHTPAGLEERVEVVSQENVTFPATAVECVGLLRELEARASAAGAKLLLQNTPGQVAMALCEIIRSHNGHAGFGGNVGVVISVPAPALPALRREFNFWSDCSEWLGSEAEMAIMHANPRACVTHQDNGRTSVEVAQPRPFVFSHVEWL